MLNKMLCISKPTFLHLCCVTNNSVVASKNTVLNFTQEKKFDYYLFFTKHDKKYYLHLLIPNLKLSYHIISIVLCARNWNGRKFIRLLFYLFCSPKYRPFVEVYVLESPHLHQEFCKKYKIKVTKNHKRQENYITCLLYTSPSPRDATLSRMPSSA